MSFSKKGAPSAKSLDLYSNDPGSSDPCRSSGVSPVNSKGQVTDKSGAAQDWPYQKFTVDNELNPRSNQTGTEILSTTPQASGDFTAGKGNKSLGKINTSPLG